MLRFGEHQAITSVDQLDDLKRKQLELAGQYWDDNEKSAEERLADDDGSETSFKGFCHYVPVYDGDKLVYDGWLYMVDSGTFFRAGTTEPVAAVIQFGLECEDPALREELGKALRYPG